MALDLLLGKTRRCWSLGFDVLNRQPGIIARAAEQEDVDALAKVVKVEVEDAYRQLVELSSAGRLPSSQRKAFRPILERWQTMWSNRGGKFWREDHLALLDLRESCRRYVAGLDAISKARTPPSPPAAEFYQPAAMSTGGMLLNLALGVSALVLVGRHFDKKGTKP